MNREGRKLQPEQLRLAEDLMLLRLRCMRSLDQITPGVESLREGKEPTKEERRAMEEGITRLETLMNAFEEFLGTHLGLNESELNQIAIRLEHTPEGRVELGI